MRRVKSLGLFVVVMIAISSSCTFDPEDVNVVNISRADIKYPVIEISDAEDTIYWRGNRSFSFSVESGFDIRGVEILLDGHLIYEGAYSSDISFDSRDFSDGHHRMIFRTLSKSNTGSIADQLNVESTITEYRKVCRIDNRPIIPEISGFTVEAGTLQLNWNSYSDLKFEKYVFQSADETMFWESTNVEDDRLVFSDFAGGKIVGNFYIYAKDEVVSTPVEFSDDMGFDVSIEGSTTRISLDLFNYTALDGFQIRYKFSLVGSETKELVYPLEVRDYTNEIIDIPVAFPSKPIYQLEAISGINISVVSEVDLINSSVLEVPNDKSIIIYEKEAYTLQLFKHHHPYYDEVAYLVDPLDGKVVNELEGNLTLSSDGNIMYQWLDNYVFRINPSNFDVLEVVQLEDEFDFQGKISRVIVSNTNILFVLVKNTGPIGSYSSPYTGYSWDRENMEMVNVSYYEDVEYPAEVPSQGSVLSSSGNFIINGLPNLWLAPIFDPLVYSSRDNLINEDNAVGLVITDHYLEGNGSTLSKRDYHNHAIQESVNLNGTIIQMFSNYNDLAAVICEEEGLLKILIINTTTLDIVEERIFNDQALESETRMQGNTIYVRFGTEVLKWEIND